MHRTTANTLVDPLIGKPTYAINLQAKTDGQALEGISRMQGELASLLPSGVWRCPPATLHMSVLPIIWARARNAEDLAAIWKRQKSIAIQIMSRIVERYHNFEIQPAALEAHQSAIILRFSPCQYLEQLRRELATTAPLEMFDISPPDLAHVTLFRFQSAIRIESIRKAVQCCDLWAGRWVIKELRLSEELVYPSLQEQKLALFFLRNL